MKKELRLPVCVIVLVLLGACANTANVTYRSDPPLATIYQGSQNMGVAPVTLTYKLTDEQKKLGTASFRGVSARWVSGATAEISSVQLNLSNGRSQEYTFQRPTSYPGVEIDVQYVQNARSAAMQALPLLMMQQQLQQQQLRQRQQQPQFVVPPSINCRSYRLGNEVHTNCN